MTAPDLRCRAGRHGRATAQIEIIRCTKGRQQSLRRENNTAAGDDVDDKKFGHILSAACRRTRKIEERSVPKPPVLVKPEADRPSLLRSEHALGGHQVHAGGGAARRPVSLVCRDIEAGRLAYWAMWSVRRSLCGRSICRAGP